MDNLLKLTKQLHDLREKASSGLTEDDFSETMKEINSVKVKIAKYTPSERKGAE